MFFAKRALPLPAAEDVQGRQSTSFPGTSFFQLLVHLRLARLSHFSPHDAPLRLTGLSRFSPLCTPVKTLFSVARFDT